MPRCFICGSTTEGMLNGLPVCSEHSNELTTICVGCGVSTLTPSDSYMTGLREVYPNSRVPIGQPMCPSCVGDIYGRCTSCGRVIDRSELTNGRCSECSVPTIIIGSRAINSYNFQPDFRLMGTPSRPHQYFGIELEIDGAGEDEIFARTLFGILNKDDLCCYGMHDGSLNRGFEIATMPVSYDYFMENIDWEGFANKAVAMGYRSHTTDTCGLHIHVSRRAFGDTEDIRDANIMKFLYFVEKFSEEIATFSRRDMSKLRDWARFYSEDFTFDEKDPKPMYDRAKDEYSKYRSVNLRHGATVEVRVFRGTLNVCTLKATVQLCKLLHELSMDTAVDDVTEVSWTTVKSMGNQYQELTNYMNSRGL